MSFAPHSRSRGFPTVLENPCTRRRFQARVYARFQLKFELNRIGDTRTVSCFASDRRFEWINVTREKLWETRASREAIAPEVGTMLVGCTNTGRPPSSSSVNRTV